MASQQQQETLTFPPAQAALLTPYLPPQQQPPSPSAPPPPPTQTKETQNEDHPIKNENKPQERKHPHLTLTYAHSLDAALALAPGVRTALSGPQSKAMTHFLRSCHDAILIGAGTAVADDPGLNSRLFTPPTQEGGTRTKQPRPVVLDPRGRWDVREGSRVMRAARERRGLGPWVFVAAGTEVEERRRRVLEGVGGRYIPLEARGAGGRFEWGDVLAALKGEGIGSVMVEGGGEVINSLLVPGGDGFVDSVIVTIAPTWLGQGGVVVSPPRTTDEDGRPADPVRLTDVAWCPLGEDVVLCGRIQR